VGALSFTTDPGSWSPQLLAAVLAGGHLDRVEVAAEMDTQLVQGHVTNRLLLWDLRDVYLTSDEVQWNDDGSTPDETFELTFGAATMSRVDAGSVTSVTSWQAGARIQGASASQPLTGQAPPTTDLTSYLGQTAKPPSFLDFGGAQVAALSASWAPAPLAGPNAPLGQLQVTVDAGADSPQLFQAVASGHLFDRVNFVTVNGGNLTAVVLKDVVLTSYQIETVPGALPQTITLTFGAAQLAYQPAGGALVTAGWDNGSTTGPAHPSFDGDAGTGLFDTSQLPQDAPLGEQAANELDLGGASVPVSAVSWAGAQGEPGGPALGAFQLTCPVTEQAPELFLALMGGPPSPASSCAPGTAPATSPAGP
jgi:type VI protein secretion system component Hcp